MKLTNRPGRSISGVTLMCFICSIWLSVFAHRAAATESKNGFDVSNASIPLQDILAGGPPRDGIPALNTPKFTHAKDTDWLDDNDLLLTVSIDGDERAYPTRILVWHEIVNDTVGGKPLTVTFCPLCGTGMVFSREVGEKTLDFGVSGLLYQSDVLMYDSQTESLWSQLAMQSVSGPLQGESLQWLNAEHISWAAWRVENPDGKVLSRETGHRRDYARNPYQGYELRDEPLFPTPNTRTELPHFSKVLGVIIDGKAKAWPLAQLSNSPLAEELAGQSLQVSYNAAQQRPLVLDTAGEPIPYVVVFWFAWQAFYPESALWQAEP